MRYCSTIVIVLLSAAGTCRAASPGDGAAVSEARTFQVDWAGLRVTGVAVSPDRSKLAAVAASPKADGHAGRIVVFDIKTGKPELDLAVGEALRQVGWLANGHVVTLDDASVRFWDLKSKAVTRVIGEQETRGPVRAMAVVPGGDAVAVLASSTRPVTIWDLSASEGKPLWEEQDAPDVASLSFDAAGGLLAVGGYRKRLVRIWDLKGGKPVAELGTPGVTETRDVAMSPDGTQVVVAAPGSWLSLHRYELVDFNIRRGSLVGLSSRDGDSVRSLAISPDGLATLAAMTSSRANELVVYETIYGKHGGRILSMKRVAGAVGAVSFVNDEEFVVSLTDRTGVSRVVAYRLTLDPDLKTQLLQMKANAQGR